MTGSSVTNTPAAAGSSRQGEALSRGTRPLLIVRSSSNYERRLSMNVDFLRTMLDVELAIRHSVTSQMARIQSEIDSYFDELDKEMRREDRESSAGGAPQLLEANASSNSHKDTIDLLGHNSAFGWEDFAAEKVTTPPLRIQKRRVSWA